jgi:hypothetical protein
VVVAGSLSMVWYVYILATYHAYRSMLICYTSHVVGYVIAVPDGVPHIPVLHDPILKDNP